MGRFFKKPSAEASLDEVERRMLYFSEVAWTLPDIAATAEAFEANYDATRYESKIGQLMAQASERLSAEEKRTWKEATRTLEAEDHYLRVMIPASEGYVDWSRVRRFALYAVLATTALLLANSLVANYRAGNLSGLR